MAKPNQKKSLEDFILEIQKVRKNPILVLSLPTISYNSALQLYDVLLGKKFPVLDVVLSTPGGDPDAAYKMAKLVRSHAEVVNVLVPFMAKSAGTLFSLCANEIVLSEIGELGPLDTQIEEHSDGGNKKFNSALNGFKALEQIKIHTLETMDLAAKLILGRSEMRVNEALSLAIQFSGHTSGTLYAKLDAQKIGEYARALDIGEKYGMQILHRLCGWPIESAKKAVTQLVRGYPSHGYVLDFDELKSLGLTVNLIQNELSKTFVELGKTIYRQDGTIIKVWEEDLSQSETNLSGDLKKEASDEK